MTDEPTDELEQRLREDLGEIADAVPVGEPSAPAAAERGAVHGAAERRRRPALAVAGVVGAAAALLIGVLIWQSDDDDRPRRWRPRIPPPCPRLRASPGHDRPGPTVPPVTTDPDAVRTGRVSRSLRRWTVPRFGRDAEPCGRRRFRHPVRLLRSRPSRWRVVAFAEG